MFIIAFILTISIVDYISNRTMGIDTESDDSYSQTKQSTLFYIIVFLIGLVLQLLSSKIEFLEKYYWYALIAYILASIIIAFILSQVKKSAIEKKREELLNIYQIVKPLVDKKGTELDFNNVPFELDYKYKNVNKITINVEPTTFKEAQCAALLQQLNAFLPTFTWNYKLRLEERQVDFIGFDKPPTLARWPGAWLRDSRYMPVGIDGIGEVAWQLDSISKNKMGRSQFLDEKGKPIGTDTSIPSQPQGLVCGGTGGGKSVAIQNILQSCLSHNNEVALGLIDIKQVEFSNYKGMKGIVGVANSTLEAVELLKVAREVMYKRNKEMAKLGIKSLQDFKPHEKSGKVYITGREYNEDDTIQVRIDGQEQTMTAAELVEYLHEL